VILLPADLNRRKSSSGGRFEEKPEERSEGKTEERSRKMILRTI
jgi:hypothetical protein